MNERAPTGGDNKQTDETLLMVNAADTLIAKSRSHDQYMSLLKIVELDSTGVLQKLIQEYQANTNNFLAETKGMERQINDIVSRLHTEACDYEFAKGLQAKRNDLKNKLYFRERAELAGRWMQANQKTYEDLKEVLEKHKQLERNFTSN